MENTATTYQDGVKVETTYSQAEKELCRQYPNFGPKLWETTKNVNLVMKVLIAGFIVQGVALVLFALSQVY